MRQKIVNTIKQSSIYSIGALSSQFIQIFLIPIYTRMFSPSIFGILAGINMFTPILNALISTAPGYSVARYYVDSSDVNDQKLTASIGLYQIVLSASVIVLPLALFFPRGLSQLVLKDNIYATYLIIALTTVFFNSIFSYGLNIIRYNFQSTKYTIVSITNLLIQVGLSILLVIVLRMDITGVLAASLITSIVSSLAVMWLTRKYFSRAFSTTKLREMLKFGLPTIPAAILGYALAYTDRYFIINYCGLADLGLYYIGSAITNVIAILFTGFQVAWGPTIWSTYKDKDAKAFYSKILDYAFSIAILGIVALSLFSQEVLTVFTSNAYLSAYKVVPYLAFSMLFTQVFMWVVPGIGIANKTVHYIWVVGVAAVINIALDFLLVPAYGMVGAAISTLIASATNYILRLVMSQKYYPMHFNFLSYFEIVAIAVGILLLWDNLFLAVSWQNILIKSGFMLVLILSLFVFKLVGKTEIKYAKQIATNYLNKLTLSIARVP